MDNLHAKLLDFFKTRGSNRRLLLVLLALVALAAFALTRLTDGSASSTTIALSNSSSSDSTQEIAAPTFYVHVVGEVKVPGVYALTIGARLFDAIADAGGFLADADQSSVNLARELTDGEQVIVSKVGAATAYAGSAGTGSSQISLNRAGEAELESLPGVGPALAGRMIAWRMANGGFKKREDLLNVSGIGDKLFAAISKLVTL